MDMKYYQNEEKSEMNILVYGRKEKTNDTKVILSNGSNGLHF
jgi:hypothetical protein